MTLPVVLPDWVPWWIPFVLIVPALLYALAFIFMPFSVLGMKPRLEAIEVKLDELHQEFRALSHRLPVGRQEVDFEDVYAPFPPRQRREPNVTARPPVPPAIVEADEDDLPVERPAPSPNMRPLRRVEPHVIRASQLDQVSSRR